MIEATGQTYQQEQASAIGSMTGTWNGPKKWENCTDAEKIERLRDEARKWQRICGQLLDRIATLEGHQHGANGEIMIQLHAANRAQMQAGQAFDILR